jgi:hypothetical protein
MIDILYNKLAAANDASLVEWKDIDESIFRKHTQHYKVSDATIATNAVNIIDFIEPPIISKNIDKEIDKDNNKEVITITKTTTKDIKQTQQAPKSKKKDNTIKPLDIIISETSSFSNSTAYVKDALVALISKEAFAKIFGATKCAEIMSGIVNNRWNKSTALFISFLLDKEICYNDKVILYNKEKNKGRITIDKNV